VNAPSPSPPDHVPPTQDDVGGVHVKYLYHRHRWLYIRGYRLKAGSDLVTFGEATRRLCSHRPWKGSQQEHGAFVGADLAAFSSPLGGVATR
jgi:hypothetical protein